MLLFADAEDKINKWLDAHQVVLAAGATAFALVFYGLAISVFITGKAPTDDGPELEGWKAKAMGVLWLAMGFGCTILAVYKLVTGLR